MDKVSDPTGAQAVISNESERTWIEYDCDGPWRNSSKYASVTYACCGYIACDKKTGYIGEGDGDSCPKCGAGIVYTRKKIKVGVPRFGR